MNRYIYILAVLVDGRWVGKQHSTYPEKEMDKLEEERKIWKLTITRNPHYKPPDTKCP